MPECSYSHKVQLSLLIFRGIVNVCIVELSQTHSRTFVCLSKEEIKEAGIAKALVTVGNQNEGKLCEGTMIPIPPGGHSLSCLYLSQV